ncbi:MAG: glycoside hydrolase family 31 protein [Solirubrobacterales bacterium]|nr:glycoside hydrolase family 31 protein [Solirubrobacterales bacterium]
MTSRPEARSRGARCRTAIAAALVLATLSVPAASAGAAVRIDPRTATVSTPAGTAIVYRSPFRIVFADARGRVVLREARGARGSLAIAPPPPALASGYGPPMQQTLYAPLEFTVGAERDVAGDSGTWAGDLLASGRTGTVFSARSVRSIARAGSGLRLVVSTTDPSGRTLIVTVSPSIGGALRVTARPFPAAGVAGIGDSFLSPPGEAFHGFGGRHLGLDQRGASFFNWTAEENVNATDFGVPGSSAGTLLYPNGPQAAYYPQASFVSSSGYGFLLDSFALARFRLDDHRHAWQADLTGPNLAYVVAPGSGPRAVSTLTSITGRQPLPPGWALGPTLDREAQLGETPAAYLARIRADLIDIRPYRLPLKAYRIEGWATLSETDLRSVIAQLHRMGIHALVYFRPFASHDAAATEAPGTYQYAIRHRLVARTSAGAAYAFGDSFGGHAVLLDFTNPATVKWWGERIRRALDLGADGFMQDFGEEVLPGMRFHDGETGVQMHNRYPVLYARATREILERYMRAHPRRRLFFYTRAGYTGDPGSAAYENGNFAGDETTDWTRSSGLAAVIPDMLNRAIGGAYGYSTDIGGYFDLFTPHATTKELLLRWAELAVFTPLFRLHGSLLAGTHVPWRYDDQTVRIYNRLARLHQRAVPLILRLWREADRTGIPPTRPLWLVYPHDPKATRQDQEWLLGPNLLVAPVITQGAGGRTVYFPAGCWHSPVSGRTIRGPKTTRVSAPLAVLPYFSRCGTRAP